MDNSVPMRSITVGRPSGSLVLVMQPLGLCIARYRRAVLLLRGLPSTQTVSADRSAFVPGSVTTSPLSVTRPSAMRTSALRREVIPALAMSL